MSFDGGYYLIKQDLVRGGIHKHTAAHPEGVSDTMLRAVNIIQAVPWRINSWVLDLMREAWVNGDLVGELPSPYDIPTPARIDDDKWATMSKEAKAQHKYEITKIHSKNAKLESQRESFLRRLDVADMMRAHDAIYFPHFLDFRTRSYPLPQDLTPQGDDISKAILMFSEGKPLADDGLRWLFIRAANTFGKDKLSFDERVAWVNENMGRILDSVADPLDGDRFWTEADEPWSFLATCREIEMASALSDPREFVSHLPIPQDGTCNGLQHLSLMGRDPVGAKATNCSIAPERYDIYQEVADIVKRMITDEAVRGNTEATQWVIKGVDRGTVKRAVMTTPYGVTQRGIRDQLISAGYTDDMEGSKSENANYLQDKISAALTEKVVAAKDIMAYIQAVAQALANANIPLRWKTPAGAEIVQAYHNLAQTRVDTLQGRVILWDEDKEMGLNKRKQVLASAPNVIHSFDAAMLAQTAIRCYDDHGIYSFAFIHDSYATHAADSGKLATVLRQVAAEMYSVDRLQEFADYIQSYAPDVELPKLPKQGDFDPSEVLEAPYFFA